MEYKILQQGRHRDIEYLMVISFIVHMHAESRIGGNMDIEGIMSVAQQ